MVAVTGGMRDDSDECGVDVVVVTGESGWSVLGYQTSPYLIE